jgi:hypothetical protein
MSLPPREQDAAAQSRQAVVLQLRSVRTALIAEARTAISASVPMLVRHQSSHPATGACGQSTKIRRAFISA